jgi:hypothetical protein
VGFFLGKPLNLGLNNKQNETPIQQHGNGTLAKHDVLNPANVGLTVRIEINLPADGDQDTYDRIFKSIRENLLNG